MRQSRSRSSGLARGRRAALVLGALIAAAAGLQGCGGDGDQGTKVPGGRLVVYSSAPLSGPSRRDSLDVVDAQRLALEEAGGKVGDHRVSLVSLDDATPKGSGWDPGKVLANARTASRDRRTIAYLGELDPGASAVSIPILNKAGILTVSAGDTATGLTRSDGGGPDEPGKYYPAGGRTFARVVQSDRIQADAVVAHMRDAGLRRVYVVDDRQGYGSGLAAQVAASAKDRGIAVAEQEPVPRSPSGYRELAAKIRASGARAMFFGGYGGPAAAQLFREVHAADRSVALLGSMALARPAFVARLGPAGRSTFLTQPTLDERLYPPAAQEFYRAFEDRYGREPRAAALYGYEAMAAVLESIEDADDRGNDRRAVRDAFFGLRNRPSVLGTYSIDGNGDTTLSDYGGYRIVDGRLVFDKVLRTSA